jgi:hypothetical protein
LLAHFSKPENKWSKAEAYQHYIRVLIPFNVLSPPEIDQFFAKIVPSNLIG